MSGPREESSPEEDAVRALLGSLRDQDPMPADVARRLDERLAGLVAERSGAGSGRDTRPESQQVSVLASARRRRRVLGGVVAAAAAVVVGGVAVTQVPGIGGSMSAGEDSAGSSETSDRAAGPDQGASAGVQDEGDGTDRSQDSGEAPGVGQSGADWSVSSGSLRRDLLALRDEASRSTPPGALPCRPPASPRIPGVEVVPVRWDGVSALVLLEPPGRRVQRVHLHPCTRGLGGLTRELPAP